MATAIAMEIVTVMETEMETAMADSNGRWQWQWQWPMVTEMAMAMADGDGNGNGNSNRDGNSNCNHNDHSNGNDDVVVTMTDTREGCLFMCQQCAGTGRGNALPPSPGHKGVCIVQRCAMGVPLQRVFAPFQGGGILRAHHGLVFLFFTTTVQFTKQPLLFPHTIQALKNPVSPLMLYLLHSYCIFLQR
jgi:hypothetical protein